LQVLAWLFHMLFIRHYMLTKILETNDFDEIIKILKNDGIIALATDTVFGLATKFDSEIGVNNIYEAKNRPQSKALPMMCTKEMLKDYVEYDDSYQRIIDTYMPGALTIVCKHKDISDKLIDKETIAIRIPDDELIVNIINELKMPLWVTSANISGEPSLSDWEDVYKSLNGRVDGIIKGKSKGDTASTIVSFVDELKVLRQGPISEKELRELL